MTWPPVFDGIGALTVDASAFDPDQLADRIPGLTWVAQKIGGTDSGGDASRLHNYTRWKARGYHVGSWVYCDGPPVHDVNVGQSGTYQPDFIIFDVEAKYKTDEGAPATWPADLVAAYRAAGIPAMIPAAVTSYGAIPGYGNQPSSIDFKAFADAVWPILAQVYDSFKPGDELTYRTDYGGPYDQYGVHQLTRSLTLSHGQAVYRPEGIDG